MSGSACIRTLIIDDESLARERIRDMLASQPQIEIIADCANGQEAIEAIQLHSPDLVFLDVEMPGIDGFGVLEGLTSLPVVLVITGAERALVKQLDPKKIHGVVRKPFDAEELANLVVACAEIRSRSAFETMAISAMIAGGPFLAWLNRFGV